MKYTISAKKLSRASFLISEWIKDFEVTGPVPDELLPFKKANAHQMDLAILVSSLINIVKDDSLFFFPEIRKEQIEFIEIFTNKGYTHNNMCFINKKMKRFLTESKKVS